MNQDKQELTIKYKIDDTEVKLTPKIVQNYIVGADKGQITMSEYKMFTELCKVRKLNPFLKEAYLIKYSNNQPATIVVGKDAIVKRAVKNTNFNGMKSGIMVLDSENNLIERKGTFKLPSETLVGGWCEVFRKDWENSIYCSVSLDEVKGKDKFGNANSNWTKQPATMVEKVAKVRALREAFVEDLSGMYDADEMNIQNSESKTIEKPITQEEPIVQNEPTEVETIKEVQYEEISMNEL